MVYQPFQYHCAARLILTVSTLASTSFKFNAHAAGKTFTSFTSLSSRSCSLSSHIFQPFIRYKFYSQTPFSLSKQDDFSYDIQSVFSKSNENDIQKSDSIIKNSEDNKKSFSKRKQNPRRYNTISKEVIKTNDKEKKKKNYKDKSKIKEKRILRIDRILSNRGLGSRSEMNDLVKKKRVAIQDEKTGKITPVKGPSVRVPKDAIIIVDGEEIKQLPLLLVYHKPKGMLSAMKDEKMGRSHLGNILDKRYVKAGMHPVGRLDYDTSGLILFSSNGDLTQRLLHPRHTIEKEYVATVENIVDENNLRQNLESGVKTSEGIHTAKLLKVYERFEIKLDKSTASNEKNDEDKGDDSESLDDNITFYTNVRLVVSEGKHRMIRRMLANVGHPVIELRRERHGMIILGDLNVGEFRHINDDEIQWAENLLNSK